MLNIPGNSVDKYLACFSLGFAISEHIEAALETSPFTCRTMIANHRTTTLTPLTVDFFRAFILSPDTNISTEVTSKYSFHLEDHFWRIKGVPVIQLVLVRPIKKTLLAVYS